MKLSPSSPIDQHRYILLLSLISASAGVWSTDNRQLGSQSMVRRDVRIEAVVREVFKAPTDHGIARELKLHVEQRQAANGFKADDYGPWSEVDLVAGTDLLVFANETIPGASIEQTLADGCGLLVKVSNPHVPFAVEDVRRVLAWERAVGRHLLESEQTRLTINAERATSGPLMASYLVESIAEGDLANPVTAQAHKFFMDLIRAQEANARFRLVILAHEINELVMAEAPPVWFRVQLIAAMLHILAEEGAHSLHDPIRQSYLVNSVFSVNRQPLVAARDVLATKAERTASESVLRRRGFDPEQQTQLIDWLRAE